MKELDRESVARCDGQEGRPAYVVVEGRVYDVTSSSRWPGGVHMRRHRAGEDLTAELRSAPHGPEKLDGFPLAGFVSKPAVDADFAPWVSGILQRFPSLRRHPHPMTVHFPIACAFGAFFFSVLRVLTGAPSFGTTSFHCLLAGIGVTPLAMLTGWASWKVNYLGRPMDPVRRKIKLSVALWIAFTAGAAWSARTGASAAALMLFGGVVVSLATALGRIGAALTFPVERR